MAVEPVPVDRRQLELEVRREVRWKSERGLRPAARRIEGDAPDRVASGADLERDAVADDAAHHDASAGARRAHHRDLAVARRDHAAGVEEIARRQGGIGEDAEVDEAHRRGGEHVAVRLLADEIGDVELVDEQLVRLHHARLGRAVERAPVGAVDDLLRAAADDVPDDGHLGEPLAEERREIAPPRRVDGHHVGALGRLQALQQLERGAEAVDAGAGEGKIVVAAEPDDIEAGAIRGVHERARVPDEDAARADLGEHLARDEVLIADVAAGAAEEPDLVAHVGDLVRPEDGDDRERNDRAQRREDAPDARIVEA